MKVILLKTVANLGRAGEIKEVKEGYARNFLLPNGLVKIATDSALKEMADRQISKAKSGKRKNKKHKELARKINNFKLTISAKAESKNNTLFGAVTPAKISAELKKLHFDVDEKFIKPAEPIKSLGYYEVMVDFGGGVAGKIGLTVVRE